MYPGRILASSDAETDSGRTKFERVRQFGRTDRDFGRPKDPT